MHFNTMLQAIETNLVSYTWRLFGVFGIPQSYVVHYFYKFSKGIWSYEIIPLIMKIVQNFWLTLIFIHWWNEKKGRFMSFSRTLVQSEMQIALTRIWTQYHPSYYSYPCIVLNSIFFSSLDIKVISCFVENSQHDHHPLT